MLAAASMIVDVRLLVSCLMITSVPPAVPSITDTWCVLHSKPYTKRSLLQAQVEPEMNSSHIGVDEGLSRQGVFDSRLGGIPKCYGLNTWLGASTRSRRRPPSLVSSPSCSLFRCSNPQFRLRAPKCIGREYSTRFDSDVKY